LKHLEAVGRVPTLSAVLSRVTKADTNLGGDQINALAQRVVTTYIKTHCPVTAFAGERAGSALVVCAVCFYMGGIASNVF